jgi:hypothetical protein
MIPIAYSLDSEPLPPEPGKPLPDSDHALRYIGKKHVDNGNVNGSGFMARPGEKAPSVNWMECFPAPIDNQVAEISARKRIKYERRSRLVRINVAHTKQYVSANAPTPIELAFLHDPLLPENDTPEDPSHAVIEGVPTVNTPDAELVQDLFVDCIIDQFPTVTDK